MAFLTSVIFAGILFAIFIVSLIVEWIEPSKVPRWYFHLMIASIVAPVLVGVVYMGIMGWDLLSVFDVDF